MLEVCPTCGLTYADFRTDLTYQEVWEMFWVASTNPRTWRYKRRHTILGKWHQIKLEMWQEHLDICEQYQALGECG